MEPEEAPTNHEVLPMKKFLIIPALLAAFAAMPAAAHSNFSIGFNLAGPAYYAPPPAPVYYQPAPVYYRPAPVYYRPAPVTYYYPTAYYGGYWGPRYPHHRYGYWR